MSNTCPKCGGKLHTTDTRRLVNLLHRYRSCHGCDYHDRATVKPAEIIHVEVIGKRIRRHQSTIDIA